MGRRPLIRLATALGLGQSGFHAWIASLSLAMVAAGRENGEIGAIMGSAAVFNIGAALLSGGLIDRFGGRRVFIGGTFCLASAAALIGSGAVGASSPTTTLLGVRLLQGVGLGAVMPAVLALVPDLVEARRLPTAMAFVGVAANLSLAIVPPLSLVVLERQGLPVIGWLVLVAMVAAMVAVWPVRAAAPARTQGDPGGVGSAPRRGGPRSFRPKWRSSWSAPLAITFLFLAHWGVVTGYLPQRADAAGADVGLFFTGDALALLALRVPAGYLAGRFGSLWLILGGLSVTMAALVLLLLTPTTPLLVAAGIGTGAGGALILPTLMLELADRSDASDRGSAFGLYSVAFSMGVALGSIGVAPVIDRVGFETALVVGMVAIVVAGLLAMVDRSHHGRMRGTASGTAPRTLEEPGV